ncbi:Concanavalin A-like lectin/glucanases superfamily [Penicillium bovifimosum]|uniref:chitinase n=1 Tax=Penicillium bovifimosum TaxID=126998 RepID=A0A9W9GP58_9EURO|nr:Concanavalin A-like lectin/glucanases superfamily [Penicillium bovifimosum]KAJ5125009.1 Concanavalin A-like lectin/glucanases superfamily [Penicillium bovifimosum]
MNRFIFFAALASILSLILAENVPDCNAFAKTCPANKGTTKARLYYDLTKLDAFNDWTTSGGDVFSGPNGAEFTINQQGEAPTIVTDFYILYGEVSVEMKASAGNGIVSSVYMLSDDNDEINWVSILCDKSAKYLFLMATTQEALGGYTDNLETDNICKGDTSEDYNRWSWQPVSTPEEVFHKYTWIWTKEKLYWILDGSLVWTVSYADAKRGSRYPQTPMRVRIGIRAGGDPSRLKCTIDWAGGETDYSKAPFTTYVKSVEIVNFTPAESYTYSNDSGSSGSIVIHRLASFDLPSLEDLTSVTSFVTSTPTATLAVSSSEMPSPTDSLSTSDSTAHLSDELAPITH